jgi:hypothetical protein
MPVCRVLLGQRIVSTEDARAVVGRAVERCLRDSSRIGHLPACSRLGASSVSSSATTAAKSALSCAMSVPGKVRRVRIGSTSSPTTRSRRDASEPIGLGVAIKSAGGAAPAHSRLLKTASSGQRRRSSSYQGRSGAAATRPRRPSNRYLPEASGGRRAPRRRNFVDRGSERRLSASLSASASVDRRWHDEGERPVGG